MMGVKTRFETLKPEFFDNLVSATKIISGYEPSSRTFSAASLAAHMGTTLKQVCHIATKMIIKKSKLIICHNQEECLTNIKRLKHLIENQWTSEVSSLALKDLNKKKWEKPKLLPLTSDVMKFQKYLVKEAKEASENILKKHKLVKEYRRLSENVLAMVVLLNRKRIEKVQFLKVETYCKNDAQVQKEEFSAALTKSEQILVKNFKRVVTGGKGSKPVPILFSKAVQNWIDVMLGVRKDCVPRTNEYLFANPKTPNKWISGYHRLEKLAKQSQVKNQELFTSTRLRKQIASFIKVLNVTDAEMEQFATFIGHTKKTHESYYGLPQGIYQTAKVSKLLLTINKGEGTKYKGKSLEKIELSENDEAERSDGDEEKNPDNLHHSPSSSNSNYHYTSGFGPCVNDNENRRVMTTKLEKRKKQNNETSNSSSDNVHETVKKQKNMQKNQTKNNTDNPTVAIDTRVVNGTTATDGQYPYQVSLRIQGIHYCSGSILNTRWILTAAYCINEKPEFTVVVGSNTLNANGVTYQVSYYVMHPLFDPDTKLYNAGLINTTTSISYSSNIQPILLTPLLPFDGVVAVITGWGISKSGSVSTVNELQTLNTIVINQTYCLILFNGYDVDSTQICTFLEHGGACSYDDGSPVVVCGIQFGIVSTRTCGSGYPDLHTKILSVYDWIISII
ncbi:hypothetical protein RN001_010687 [Aquatica leii]|uniref:Peptidase S1 domain-containing protein n=1 Tax=Aquatica leii TaxID=1421715 RepID=A0AAN7PA99_9COLE|nr:hypothetical protein RN001_010687 [Aquatica leii]